MKNTCEIKKDFCQNCNNHYAQLRPSIKGYLVSNRFDNEDPSVIEDILECNNINYTELHKFEKHVDGNPVFRAKKDGVHIVYTIDKDRKLILFLRTFGNFTKYKRFLEDDRDIKRAIKSIV